MKKLRVLVTTVLIGLTLAWTIGACGGDDDGSSKEKKEICDNQLDDDGDGATDCNDTDCATDPACTNQNNNTQNNSTQNNNTQNNNNIQNKIKESFQK